MNNLNQWPPPLQVFKYKERNINKEIGHKSHRDKHDGGADREDEDKKLPIEFKLEWIRIHAFIDK